MNFLTYLAFIHVGYGNPPGSSRTVLWSDKRTTCHANSECVIPRGETWILDANMDVGTLTIYGKLSWHIARRDLELRALFVLVEQGGTLEIGTESAPMELNAQIYIKTPPNWDPRHSEGWDSFGYHPRLGSRFFAGVQGSQIKIHGRKLERTWSLLDRNHNRGSTELHLKHDAQCMGWRVGDSIAVATTSRGDSSTHTIAYIQGKKIGLNSPLNADHYGGYRNVEGFNLEMAAEVINLDRNIRITGDSEHFSRTSQGIHTGTFWADGSQTVFDVRYTRVEHCGQKDVLGRYCFHFHLSSTCERCILKGNAVFDSVQSAITIHGTHKSLTDENVIWNPRSVGIYTEDGNEMNNVISNNVIMCPGIDRCAWVGNEWQNQNGIKEAGIYLLGMTNDVIGNHVIGMEHGFWSPGAGNYLGKGMAAGKVCPQFMPFGKMKGNVNHDCQRFGVYPDYQYPRNVQVDADGFVIKNAFGEMESCNEFTKDGKDNGIVPANVIEDQFDWHNVFVGQYYMGDITYRRLISVNNVHGMYWKRSKNFADGRSYHIEDSLFLCDSSDPIGMEHTYLPGGAFTFRMRNVTYGGTRQHAETGALVAPQHCGMEDHNHGHPGGTCHVQYLLEDVDLSRVGALRATFGISGGNPFSPMYLSTDGSMGGYAEIISPHLNGFGAVAGCSGPLPEYGGAYGCDASVKIRRLTIWAPDMGNLQIRGQGYQVGPNWGAPSYGTNAGTLYYDVSHMALGFTNSKYDQGYGAHVIIGQEYVIENLRWIDDIFIEVSDPILAHNLQNAPNNEFVRLKLNMGGHVRSCTVSALDQRLFQGADGVAKGAPVNECTRVFRELGEINTGTQHTTTTTPVPTTIPENGECPCHGAEWEPLCATPGLDEYGGLGCSACGVSYCRYCGHDHWPPCPNKPNTSTPSDGSSTQKPTTKTTTHQTPPSNDCCDNASYDPQCQDPGTDQYGGFGCAACGVQTCRYCGYADLPPCYGGGNTPKPTKPSTPSNNPCTDCYGTKYDKGCEDPGTDQYGGLGCAACGISVCRFCGEGIYPAC